MICTISLFSNIKISCQQGVSIVTKKTFFQNVNSTMNLVNISNTNSRFFLSKLKFNKNNARRLGCILLCRCLNLDVSHHFY